MNTPSVAPPPRLAARDITVRFGGLLALDSVDIEVAAGTITGLVGPNGAGKSTLFAVLSGLRPPQGGTVLLDGRDVTRASAQGRARSGMARTFQHPELFTGLTVREHLELAYRVRFAHRRLWSDLLTGGAFRRAPAPEAGRIAELAAQLEIEHLLDGPAIGLPLGTSRLIELARSLACDPAVLLLDEPFSGLDSHETTRLAGTLREIVERDGPAVLLVEHDVELVLGLSARVAVLDFGRMIAHGTPADIAADPRVRAAYLGEAITEQEDQ
ncbi:ABC transporter ATP-binding protein [Nocardia alni]|uniref:ABC transporter ATP-binding protein n=1 Tax=Nocardia alni TaxID=2815723 RepID=UPI001C213F19|nr:ABC transporter ATP-binding protein [Nocardia alni]